MHADLILTTELEVFPPSPAFMSFDLEAEAGLCTPVCECGPKLSLAEFPARTGYVGALGTEKPIFVRSQTLQTIQQSIRLKCE